MGLTKEKRAPGSDYNAFPGSQARCIGSELSVVDDQDIPFSYILYVVCVITIIGVLLVGGFFLWIR
jgi:hypothetical protein